MIRVECILAETLYCIPVHHAPQFIVIPHADFLLFMAGTESIEEMHYRHLACDGRKVSNSAQIHDFLNIRGTEHCKPCLSACHNIGVISENRKCMRRNRSRCHVHYSWGFLCCQFIHIRDHQKESLGSGKCTGVRTRSDRSVYCSCSTAF